MREMFDLTRRVALVTGGATGIGRAVALALAEAGADIAITSHRTPSEDLERRVREAGGRYLETVIDLSSRAATDSVVERVEQELGRIDILVNNAGMIRRAPAIEYSDADWDSILELNLTAIWRLSRSAGRGMLERSQGKIINIASLLSFQGGIFVPAYTASKHAVAGLTRALANEWAPYGVNVNAIAPGYIETANTAPLRADPERSAKILGRIPAGRWGRPEDLGGAAVFLASSASDYVHGTVLPVDGGWLSG